MAQAQQHGEMKVSCNVCRKEATVKVMDFYRLGGLHGGCCRTEKTEGVFVANTWSTVPSATKRATHKSSRDKVARSSRK